MNLNPKEGGNTVVKALSLFLFFCWLSIGIAFWRVMSLVRELKEPQLIQIKMLFIATLAAIGGVFTFTVIAFIILLVYLKQLKREVIKARMTG